MIADIQYRVFACIKVDFAGKFFKFFWVRYFELK